MRAPAATSFPTSRVRHGCLRQPYQRVDAGQVAAHAFWFLIDEDPAAGTFATRYSDVISDALRAESSTASAFANVQTSF